jgi:hypothetical protein
MKHANSNLDGTFVTAKPRSTSFAVVDALRSSLSKGNPIKFARLRSTAWDNIAEKHVSYEVAEARKPSDKVDVRRIAELHGSRAAGSQCGSETKRFKITVKDKVTGEPKEVLAKLTTTTLTVVSYGVAFHFVKTNRGASVLDTRDGLRKPQAFVRSELRRILGATEGDAKFTELLA